MEITRLILEDLFFINLKKNIIWEVFNIAAQNACIHP